MVAEVTSWILVHAAGLLPLIGYFGGGGVLFALCLVGWYFAPLHRADFLWAALIVAAVMASIAFGVHIGDTRKQAQWDETRAIEFKAAEQARADGVRAAARKPHRRWLSKQQGDPDLRD